MKKIFKKNQVIITALAIMIAVAGYLNFTKDNTEEETTLGQQVGSNIGSDIFGTPGVGSNEDGKDQSNEFADISDEDRLEVSDVGDIILPTDTASNKGDTASNKDDTTETGTTQVRADGSESGANPGEAVLASTTINSGFFSSSKLAREQVRAKNKEMLMDIVENASVTDDQKQAALDSILVMTEVAETENSTELLLEAKGFDGVVVSIVDDTVDVVVNTEAITDQQVAQIEDIVMRKTGLSAECIVISAVVMEE